MPQIDGQPIKADRDFGEEPLTGTAEPATAHEQGLPISKPSPGLPFSCPRARPLAIVQKLNAATVAAMNTRPCRSE